MADPMKNPDLAVSYQRPGVYVFQSRQGAAPQADNRRVLFLGPKTSAGSFANNVAHRVNNETDAVLGAGAGSTLVREYRAYQSWARGGSETFFLPIAAAGTPQTRLLTVMALPTTDGHVGSQPGAVLDLDTQTGSKAAGVWDLWIEGYLCSCLIANGDLYSAIATNMLAEIQKVEPFLSCTVSRSGATLTLTQRAGAEFDQNLPIISRLSSGGGSYAAMYLAISCGTLTLANASDADTTQSTGHTLLVTTMVAQYAPGNAEAAATAAGGFITAINATDAYPLTGARAAGSAVITLVHVNDAEVDRLLATTLDTNQTLTLACGTAGAGVPTLTAALAHLETQEAFRLIVCPYNDTATLGTLSSHIELEGNGLRQKGQHVVFCDTRRLTTAGAIPPGTTPALTASPRYFMGWHPASPQQAYELAARMAATIINNLDYPPFNYAGSILGTDGKVPLRMPRAAVRPSGADINAAMVSYFMTPLVVNSLNQLVIESGRTTAKPSAILDGDYRWWGVQLADDYVRDDLVVSIPGVIIGKNFKAKGQPHTAFTTTPDAVKAKVFSRMQFYDAQDIFDDADGLKAGLQAKISGALPSRLDVEMPKRFPVPAEQVSIVTTKAS